MANNGNLKPFKKGDVRINRNGRPKSFLQLRKLAQQIAHEEVKVNGAPLVINGKKATATEVILRKWANSKNPKLQQLFIETAFGKDVSKVDVTSDGKPLLIRVSVSEDD